VNGYTRIFENMLLLDSNISIRLNVDFFKSREEGKLPEYGMLVYTGPIDSYFAQQASHPHSVVSPRMVLLPALMSVGSCAPHMYHAYVCVTRHAYICVTRTYVSRVHMCPRVHMRHASRAPGLRHGRVCRGWSTAASSSTRSGSRNRMTGTSRR
jgi:hypothetical protein